LRSSERCGAFKAASPNASKVRPPTSPVQFRAPAFRSGISVKLHRTRQLCPPRLRPAPRPVQASPAPETAGCALAMSVLAPGFGASPPCLLAVASRRPRRRRIPSQQAATFDDGQSKHPRSHLEKADRNGTRTDQRLASAGTRITAAPGSTPAPSSNHGAHLFRSTQQLTIEYFAEPPPPEASHFVTSGL
jgi:hypothetical protein